jgi:hypothetical protein
MGHLIRDNGQWKATQVMAVSDIVIDVNDDVNELLNTERERILTLMIPKVLNLGNGQAFIAMTEMIKILGFGDGLDEEK